MGFVCVVNRLKQTELLSNVMRFLRHEHNAKISLHREYREYFELDVTGDGIPDGQFNIFVEEIVPNVLAITIDE